MTNHQSLSAPRVEWIGISPGNRQPIEPRDEVTVAIGTGIDGDYHSQKKPGGERQVTLIQAEHFEQIIRAVPRPSGSGHVATTEPLPNGRGTESSLTGRDSVSPELFRRNIVVRGIELTSLIGHRFRIGEALLEGTGPCTPCSRMDENLGEGGRLAMKGLGGLTARVIQPGRIRLGDSLTAEA